VALPDYGPKSYYKNINFNNLELECTFIESQQDFLPLRFRQHTVSGRQQYVVETER